MSTDPQDFASLVNELIDGALVCADKLCRIEPEAPPGSNVINLKDPTTKITVLGARDCKPCTDLKAIIGADPRVSFIYMDDEADPNSERGFAIVEKAGWSGTTPAVYIEQNGEVIGELWEGARDTEPGSLDATTESLDEPVEDSVT